MKHLINSSFFIHNSPNDAANKRKSRGPDPSPSRTYLPPNRAYLPPTQPSRLYLPIKRR